MEMLRKSGPTTPPTPPQHKHQPNRGPPYHLTQGVGNPAGGERSSASYQPGAPSGGSFGTREESSAPSFRHM